jgi:hypothetical protein
MADFIVGFIIGCVLGVFVCALIQARSDGKGE